MGAHERMRCTVKQSTTGGTFRFGNRVLYLANALTGELAGLDERDDIMRG